MAGGNGAATTTAWFSDEDLRALQAHVREEIDTGDPPARKTLLQALVAQIRVVNREGIYPTFSLPAVRPLVGSVGGLDSTSNLGIMSLTPFVLPRPSGTAACSVRVRSPVSNPS
jgi:hypothetical protein